MKHVISLGGDRTHNRFDTNTLPTLLYVGYRVKVLKEVFIFKLFSFLRSSKTNQRQVSLPNQQHLTINVIIVDSSSYLNYFQFSVLIQQWRGVKLRHQYQTNTIYEHVY